MDFSENIAWWQNLSDCVLHRFSHCILDCVVSLVGWKLLHRGP